MRKLLLTLLLAFPYTPAALAEREQSFVTDPEPDTPSSVRKGEPWKERAVALPPWPKDADLVEFELDGPPSALRYSIDGKNLRVGVDAVVRYTLVADSTSGSRNVSFEGIRCTLKGAYKVYAFGVGNRFKKSQSEWQPIPNVGIDPLHRQLWGQFLCVPLKLEPRPVKDVIRAMGSRVHHEANTGFLPD